MGQYAVMTGRAMYSTARIIALPHGGETQCTKQEVILIPCPKVRKGIPTRWRTHAGKNIKSLRMARRLATHPPPPPTKHPTPNTNPPLSRAPAARLAHH